MNDKVTYKQYEHLGRAAMLAAALARRADALDDLRFALKHELEAVIGKEAAQEADKRIMSDPAPVWRLGVFLNDVTQQIAKGGAK